MGNIILNRNEVTEYLNKCRISLENEYKSLSSMINMEYDKEDIINHVSKYSTKSWKNTYDLLQEISIPLEEMAIIPESNLVVNFETSEEKGIYHFVCDSLLPKNPPVYDKLSAWIWSRDNIKAAYRLSLMKFHEQFPNMKPFDEPIMVLFINHFKDMKNVVDQDNFSTKFFIDEVINDGGFILDDSPEKISMLSIASLQDDLTYSEIYLGKSSDVLDLAYEYYV